MSITHAKRLRQHSQVMREVPSLAEAKARLEESRADTQPSGPTFKPGSLPVQIGLDGLSIIVHTWNGREIMLLPTEQGMETLLKLLDIERRRVQGQSLPIIQQTNRQRILDNLPLVTRFDTKGKRQLSLADLGL